MSHLRLRKRRHCSLSWYHNVCPKIWINNQSFIKILQNTIDLSKKITQSRWRVKNVITHTVFIHTPEKQYYQNYLYIRSKIQAALSQALNKIAHFQLILEKKGDSSFELSRMLF